MTKSDMTSEYTEAHKNFEEAHRTVTQLAERLHEVDRERQSADGDLRAVESEKQAALTVFAETGDDKQLTAVLTKMEHLKAVASIGTAKAEALNEALDRARTPLAQSEAALKAAHAKYWAREEALAMDAARDSAVPYLKRAAQARAARHGGSVSWPELARRSLRFEQFPEDTLDAQDDPDVPAEPPSATLLTDDDRDAETRRRHKAAKAQPQQPQEAPA